MFNKLAVVLDAAINRANQISRWIAISGGIALMVSIAMIIIEVFFRKIAGRSIFPATELTGYLMAIIASWSFAYTMLNKAHIRIDAIYVKCGSRTRAALDVLSACCLAIVCLYASDAAMGVALEAFHSDAKSNSPLMTPLWIPQSLWMLGILWFTAFIFLVLLRALIALLCNDRSRFNSLLANPSVEDHINEITEG